MINIILYKVLIGVRILHFNETENIYLLDCSMHCTITNHYCFIILVEKWAYFHRCIYIFNKRLRFRFYYVYVELMIICIVVNILVNFKSYGLTSFLV